MSARIVSTAKDIAYAEGADGITVRRILKELGITNRVFYNRFRNIEEVLDIIYEDTVLKMRESISADFDTDGNFFEQIIDTVTNTLIMSYDVKSNFNSYAFENDSASDENYIWWKNEICRLIEFAKENKLIKNIDSDIMSYAIWCFIRGYNADAVGRKLSKEEAVSNFRYSFSILLDGMKT